MTLRLRVGWGRGFRRRKAGGLLAFPSVLGINVNVDPFAHSFYRDYHASSSSLNQPCFSIRLHASSGGKTG